MEIPARKHHEEEEEEEEEEERRGREEEEGGRGGRRRAASTYSCLSFVHGGIHVLLRLGFFPWCHNRRAVGGSAVATSPGDFASSLAVRITGCRCIT
jgi:hypothetical protein